MRTVLILLLIPLSLVTASGCLQTKCGEGTVDRNGVCETSAAPVSCGPFTRLDGGLCVPEYEPTQCDPATTTATTAPDGGVVVTCVATADPNLCRVPLACAAPSGSAQLTICGQLYDVETGEPFAASGARGQRCDPASPTTSGPCALELESFDTYAYAGNPTTAPLAVGDVYLDDCGRYRLTGIDTTSTGPSISVGVTEAGEPFAQPLANVSVSAATAVATPKPTNRVVPELNAFIARPSTIVAWQGSGGVALADGLYVGLFKAHKPGNGDPWAPQAGVSFSQSGNPIADRDVYFTAAEVTLSTLDPAETATGANGAGLLLGATGSEGPVYSGAGGLGAHCLWDTHAAANVPNVVFVQPYFKKDVPLDGVPCAD